MTQVLERPAAPAAGRERPAAPRPRRRWPHRMVPLALLLLGVLVLVYPVGATLYNNYTQHEFARQYDRQVAATASTELAASLASAAAYNAALPASALSDPWSSTDPKQSAAYQAYLGQLDALGAMARIRIPSLKVDLPVYHGTSDETLSKGVGHLFGSTLPVGGPGTHAVLTGHSSLASATMFDHLPRLAVGDRFYIDVFGRTLAYEVDQIKAVLPDQLDDLRRVEGQDYVTLITCTPYAVNSHRLLVRAHAVPYIAAVDPKTDSVLAFDWSIQSWMWPRFIGAGVALLVLLAMIIGWVRSDRRRARRLAQRRPQRPAVTGELAAPRHTSIDPPAPTT